MKIANTLCAVLLAVTFKLHATQLESVAGTLHELITDTQISQLTLTGTINAADIEWLTDNLPQLSRLDITDARITAYSGPRLHSGHTTSPADHLPDYSLMGSNIIDIILPRTLTGIGSAALAATPITHISLPATITHIGTGAFAGCTSLTAISLPAGITTISPLTFKGCTSLTTVSLPAGLQTIGNEAFRDCTSLTTVSLPAGLQTIGNSAMSHTALTHIDLSHCTRLSSIGSWTFAHCHNLETATLSQATTTVGDGLFFDCNTLTAVNISTNITALTPYMFKGTTLRGYPTLTGPNTRSIGEYALYGNDLITQLWLPRTLTHIGTRAMAHMTALERIDASYLTELPTLGQQVFQGTASPAVTIEAIESIAPLMQVTEQWKEFNIVTVDEPDLSHSADIHTVTVYTLNATILQRHTTDPATRVTLPLPRRGATVIVELQLTDHSRHTYKIVI